MHLSLFFFLWGNHMFRVEQWLKKNTCPTSWAHPGSLGILETFGEPARKISTAVSSLHVVTPSLVTKIKKKSLFLSAQLVVHEHPAHILFNRVQPKNSAPMFWARFSGNTLLICPPGLSAMSTTSSWTASWSLVPPVKIPTRARRRAQTARAHAQTRNGEKRPAKNGRQRPGKRRPRVWHNRRASRCRGTRPTPGKEPGWESCPKPSPGLRPPYPGYHRIPSSPNWTHCAWRLAT